MTESVFQFKAINRRLNCNEQKADFEEKNPKPEPNKVVWSPEWGYGVAPFGGFTPEAADALAQQLVDNYALTSRPPLSWLKTKI